MSWTIRLFVSSHTAFGDFHTKQMNQSVQKNNRENMKQMTRTLAGIALGCCMASAANASIIKSMTIEEISVASGGLGTSAASSGGGKFGFSANALASENPALSASFISAGSNDDAIVMGLSQTDNGFTPGFVFANLIFHPNTLAAAPSGMIDGSGNLILDLSGWGVDVSHGLGYFLLSPDAGTLFTSLAATSATRFFYTADWHHQLTDDDDPSGAYVGFITYWHLEGIATVPEPSTLSLLGASVLGLMTSRRRKHA